MTTKTALQKKRNFIVYAALKSVLCIGLFKYRTANSVKLIY